MKKIISVLLALVMVLSMGVVAFAEEPTTHLVATAGELKTALENVQDGDTIKLTDDIVITEETAVNNGSYVDGVYYEGDASFIIDFNTFSITDDGCVNDYLIYFKNMGTKVNEITLMNGTIKANAVEANPSKCFAALCVGRSDAICATTVNLNNMVVEGKNATASSANDVVRIRGFESVLNINENTVIISDGCSAAVNSTNAAVANINSGAKIIQKNSGTTGGMAVTGTATVNIYEGVEIESDKYGVHTSSSGTPVVNVYGGIIDAAIALKASSNGGAYQVATINVSGGSISGSLEEQSASGNIYISGGSFDADPEEYLTDEVEATATATSGTETIYAIGEESIQEVAAAAEAGDTIEIKGSVALTDVPKDVVIKNANDEGSDSSVTVNGTQVNQGETVTAPEMPAPVIVPEREPVRETVTVEIDATGKADAEKETEDEENPNTGAPVMMPVMAVLAVLSGAVISKK